MKVILLSDVASLGTRGTVVNVADGYANNFLFPRKLAAHATDGALKTLEQQNKARARRQEEEVSNAKEVAEQLEQTVLKVTAKAGGNGRLFGTVTNANVAEAIQAGDLVDLIATFTAQPVVTGNQPAGPPVIATQRVLQDVLVLQMGPWPSEGAKNQNNGQVVVATMQLNEQDALVLKYTQENASGFALALRPANDHDLANPEPVTLEYINKRFGYKLPIAGQ